MMMAQVVLVVYSRDAADRSEDDQIGKPVVPARAAKEATVNAVVTDDEQSVVASCNDGDCQTNDPPSGPRSNGGPGENNGCPEPERIKHGTRWTQETERTNALRG